MTQKIDLNELENIDFNLETEKVTREEKKVTLNFTTSNSNARLFREIWHKQILSERMFDKNYNMKDLFVVLFHEYVKEVLIPEYGEIIPANDIAKQFFMRRIGRTNVVLDENDPSIETFRIASVQSIYDEILDVINTLYVKKYKSKEIVYNMSLWWNHEFCPFLKMKEKQMS